MNLTKILIFLVLLSCFIDSAAQTNFLPGYYLTTGQDTVRGYIEFQSERRNFHRCVYKRDLKSKLVEFDPAAIAGYSIESAAFYESHAFKEKDGHKFTGFFKVLAKGRISLLTYGSRYFVKDSQNRIYDISKTSKETNGLIKVDYTGLGTLKTLMKDCGDNSGAIIDEEFRANPDYLNIFEKHRDCIGAVVYPRNKIKLRPHISWGLLVSPSLTRLKLRSDYLNASLTNDVHPKVGIVASFSIPQENLRLVVEATYGKFNQYIFFTSQNTNNDLFVNYSFLEFPVLLRYSTHNFFVDVGRENQMIMNQHISWRIETVQQSTVLTSDGQLEPLHKWSNGFIVGCGYSYSLFNHVIRNSVRICNALAANLSYTRHAQSLEVNLSVQIVK
jgi:hypothetical protein